MNTILKRTVSGIVYLILIVGSLFTGSVAFVVLLLCIGTIALYEFYKLADATAASPVIVTGLVAGIVMIATAFLVSSRILDHAWLSSGLFLVLLLFVLTLFMNHQKASRNVALQLLGIVYVSLPLAASTYIIFPKSFQYEYTHRIMLGIFILIWINDTFAYLTGITIGRHRLYEKISPKKSWEGVAGGSLFTMVSAFWMSDLMNALTRKDWLVTAIIVSLFGVFGDLFESVIKREVSAKDSGNLIPGHGGVLDRIDSMLFVVPVVFIYMILNNL
ncbi:MAG: phosphatidate cytidylyltransferase [Bacteroidales bacterium]|nr:phosphatidate cytidylyltransferase [Bacteroidales bacterium]